MPVKGTGMRLPLTRCCAALDPEASDLSNSYKTGVASRLDALQVKMAVRRWESRSSPHLFAQHESFGRAMEWAGLEPTEPAQTRGEDCCGEGAILDGWVGIRPRRQAK
jgi:hypothetical protein